MNREQLRQNIGKRFKFFPIPVRNSAIGAYESDKNEWLLRRETADKKGFEFLNLFGDYNSLILDPLKIKNFDEPDTLILRGQVFFDGSTVRYEPFTERPASAGAPKTSLMMLLERADQAGILHITHDSTAHLATIQFAVTNAGEQTVRDYRVELLVPQSIRYFFGMHPGGLNAETSIMIGEQSYAVYRRAILEPIYKDETVRVAEMVFTIDLGDHTLLWRIRSDDGVFPSETDYGELKLEARQKKS